MSLGMKSGMARSRGAIFESKGTSSSSSQNQGRVSSLQVRPTSAGSSGSGINRPHSTELRPIKAFSVEAGSDAQSFPLTQFEKDGRLRGRESRRVTLKFAPDR